MIKLPLDYDGQDWCDPNYYFDKFYYNYLLQPLVSSINSMIDHVGSIVLRTIFRILSQTFNFYLKF